MMAPLSRHAARRERDQHGLPLLPRPPRPRPDEAALRARVGRAHADARRAVQGDVVRHRPRSALPRAPPRPRLRRPREAHAQAPAERGARADRRLPRGPPALGRGHPHRALSGARARARGRGRRPHRASRRATRAPSRSTCARRRSRRAPLLTVEVDGQVVQRGARAGARAHCCSSYREAGGWRVGLPPQLPSARSRSGPAARARSPTRTTARSRTCTAPATPPTPQLLKQAAERGAQGWPLWLWRVQQKVVADTEVTDALMRSHHLVLYATPGSNGVLERIAARLPIRIDAASVALGARRIEGKGVGTKLHLSEPARARPLRHRAGRADRRGGARRQQPAGLPARLRRLYATRPRPAARG